MVHVITRRLLIFSLVVVAQWPLLGTTLAQDATPGTRALPDGVIILANGLDNPRNFTWDDGALIITLLALGSGTGDGQGALVRIDLSANLPISPAGVDRSTPTCNANAAKLIEAIGSGAITVDNEPAPTTTWLQNPLTTELTTAGRTFGINCLTFDKGGSEQVVGHGGARVSLVESGRLAVTCAEGSPRLEFVRIGTDASRERRAGLRRRRSGAGERRYAGHARRERGRSETAVTRRRQPCSCWGLPMPPQT